MKTGFNATTRQVVFVLPALMGIIEYVLRVGFEQPGKDEFFPISLIVAGIGLCIAMTTLQQPSTDRGMDQTRSVARSNAVRRRERETSIAALGIWLSMIGVVWWIYLLAASFSERVQEIIPYYPLCGAVLYYGLGAGLTEWKARLSKNDPCA